MMRTRPIGSIIGAVAGLVFVLVNAASVPGSLIWRIAAAVAFVAIIWFVVLRGPAIDQVSPSRAALRTYGVSVLAMVVAIPAGSTVINNVFDKPNAVVVWVVFVVGTHFWPLARAFAVPVLRSVSVSLVVVAIIGAVPTLAANSAAAAGWTGIVAGFALLLFSAVGPRLTQESPAAP